MNRVTLIQLRGNIPYTLSGIGGIDSKYNPMIVSISTKLESAPFYPMKCLEALQSISQIPKESVIPPIIEDVPGMIVIFIK